MARAMLRACGVRRAPRGAPQYRHLIGVESDAFSPPSSTMPTALQFMQTTLNSKRWLIASLAER